LGIPGYKRGRFDACSFGSRRLASGGTQPTTEETKKTRHPSTRDVCIAGLAIAAIGGIWFLTFLPPAGAGTASWSEILGLPLLGGGLAICLVALSQRASNLVGFLLQVAAGLTVTGVGLLQFMLAFTLGGGLIPPSNPPPNPMLDGLTAVGMLLVIAGPVWWFYAFLRFLRRVT
jgi:hypothetical protein